MGGKVTSGSADVGLFLFVIAVLVLAALWWGWMLMLLFGIAHSIWPSVPLFGFWKSTGIAFVVSAVAGMLRGGK